MLYIPCFERVEGAKYNQYNVVQERYYDGYKGYTAGLHSTVKIFK